MNTSLNPFDTNIPNYNAIGFTQSSDSIENPLFLNNQINQMEEKKEFEEEYPDTANTPSLNLDKLKSKYNSLVRLVKEFYPKAQSLVEEADPFIEEQEGALPKDKASDNPFIFSPSDYKSQFDNLNIDLQTISASGAPASDQFFGYISTLVKYTGLVGNLFQETRATLVSIQVYMSLRRYTLGVHIPRKIGDYFYPSGDKYSIVYQGINRTTRKIAADTKQLHTQAYAKCFYNHLYWKSQILKLIGNIATTVAIFMMALPYLMSVFGYVVDPQIYRDCAIYLELAAIGFFMLVSAGTGFHDKVGNFLASRAKTHKESIELEIQMLKNQGSWVSLNDNTTSTEEDAYSSEDSEKINYQKDLLTKRDTAILSLIENDLDYCLNHLCHNLIREYTIIKDHKRLVKDNNITDISLSSLYDCSKETPIYNFLTGIIGLTSKKVLELAQLYSKEETKTQAIEQIPALVYNTSIVRH